MDPYLGGGSDIDVRGFGARGDGITDDAPAFRRALAAASRSGSSVLVPDGRYALGEDANHPFGCVDLPAGASLYGTGTLLFRPGVRDSVRMLRIAAPDVTVRGIGVDLSSAPRGTSFAVSVQSGARDILLADVAIRGNPSRGGVQIIGGQDITLLGCQVLDMAQNGVTLYGDGVGDGPNRVLIDGCHITAGVQPIDCEPVNGAVCRDVTIRRSHLVALSDNYALTLSGSRSAVVRDCTLRGSLYLVDAVDARVEGCLIDATSAIKHDAVVAFGKSARCALIDNLIEAATNRIGIHIARRSSGTPRDFRIQSNLVRARGEAGVGIAVADARHLRVVRNEIVGRGAVGIEVSMPSRAAEQTNLVQDNLTKGFTRPVRMRVRGR